MNLFTRSTFVAIISIFLIATMSYTSIPQNDEHLEENTPSSYTWTYGDTEHGAERIGMIWTQEENYDFIWVNEGVVPMTFHVNNLTVGEEYTIDWTMVESGEIIQSGSVTFIGDNETNALKDNGKIGKDNVSFEITAPTLRELFSINASLMDQNGTKLHWINDVRTTWYHWDWVDSETDWKDGVDIEGSWGDEISIDYTFTHLNSEQEYNMSWCLIKDVDRGYGCATTLGNTNAILEGGPSIITPNSDGNYETSISFEMLESWESERVCIEYLIKIDEGESRGQTLEKCIHFKVERDRGLPSISGFATIMSVLCAAMIFTAKRRFE